MFMKNSTAVFMFLILLSTMIAVSSSSWFNAWLSLEMNMMSIIPVMLSSKNFLSISSSIKYFLIQAMASMFVVLVILFCYTSMVFNLLNVNKEALLIAMSIKSGMPPFHFWLPQVIEAVDVNVMIMLLTWQKIAPFMFISYCVCSALAVIIILAGGIGAISGFNQNSMKKIMVYSSMIHGAWMFMAMFLAQQLWTIYFFLYAVSLMLMCYTMMKLGVYKISELNSNKMSEKKTVFFMMNILSMSGLPPFVGFSMKLMVLLATFKNEMMLMLVFMLVMFSFMSVYFYLKMAFSVYLMKQKKIFSEKLSMSYNIPLMIFLMLNMMVPVIVCYS